MKLYARYFLLLLILLGCAALSAAQDTKPSPKDVTQAAENNPDSWKVFSSTEGRFSILLPGTPKEETEEVDTPSGKFEIHKLTLRTFADYGVIYADYPMQINDSATANQILDNGAKGAVAEVNSELLSMTKISLDGHPGRLLKERMRDGSILRAKMLLVGQRLYQVAITTPKEEGVKAEAISFFDSTASKFLDSFKLTSQERETLGEVDKLLKELKVKNEIVLGNCEEGAQCTPLLISDDKTTAAADVTPGKVLNMPQPAYPPIARAAHASGTVQVQVVIDESGKVIAAQALSGHPLLRAVSVKAARELLFTPTLLNSKAVKVAGVVNYNFRPQ